MWIGNHLGTSFQIWNGRHTWFWFVADPCCSVAAIGAAANRVDAIGEACRSIEEMESRRLHGAEAPQISKAALRMPRKCDAANRRDFGWNDLLANLERYLTRLCGQCV
jgi:hypothetical protein